LQDEKKKCLFSREIYPQKSAKIKFLEPLSADLFVDVRAWQLRALTLLACPTHGNHADITRTQHEK